VHAYNDDDHDNACRYKRIVSWLIFVSSNTSRRQIEPLYTYFLIAFYHENAFLTVQLLYIHHMWECIWRLLIILFLIFYLHAILPLLWSLLERTVSVNELFTLLIERAIALCWLFVGQIYILYIRKKFDHHYCRHVVITN
jgi:hypothetical protein